MDDKLKKVFFNLEIYPWIPGPGGINLTKGVGSALGNSMETQSPLGILLRPSYFPPLFENPKNREKYEELLEKLHTEFGKPMRRQEADAIFTVRTNLPSAIRITLY